MRNAVKNTNKTYKKKHNMLTQIVYILKPSSFDDFISYVDLGKGPSLAEDVLQILRL